MEQYELTCQKQWKKKRRETEEENKIKIAFLVIHWRFIASILLLQASTI